MIDSGEGVPSEHTRRFRCRAPASAGGAKTEGGPAIVAVLATAFALVGFGFHVVENLDAGPLDRNYAATWDSMSSLDQWFTAVTGGVGPAPTLAPGVLVEMGLGLLLATVRHPAVVDEADGAFETHAG